MDEGILGGRLPVGAITGGYIPPGMVQAGDLSVDTLARYVGFTDTADYLRFLGLPEDATLDDVAIRMWGLPHGMSSDE